MPSSDSITLRQALNVIDGLRHAGHLDLLPNRHVTIGWERGGVDNAGPATAAFLKHVKDGLRAKGACCTHVWVREVGRIRGDHVHLLIHIPPQHFRWFNAAKGRWLRKAGAQIVQGFCKTRAIRGAALSASSSGPNALYRENLQAVTRYLLKHCSPDVQDCLGIKGAGPCLMTGKRVSLSQNIGVAARTKCNDCSSHVRA